MYMYLIYMYSQGHATSAFETRGLARGGGGSESSESSDEEYICKDESAFAPLFLIHNRSDRALLLWCFGAFFLRFLILRTQKQNRRFLVHILIF